MALRDGVKGGSGDCSDWFSVLGFLWGEGDVGDGRRRVLVDISDFCDVGGVGISARATVSVYDVAVEALWRAACSLAIKSDDDGEAMEYDELGKFVLRALRGPPRWLSAMFEQLRSPKDAGGRQ